MLIKEVDMVGLEPAQATLDHSDDILRPAIHADDLVALETRAKLGGDHHLLAPVLESTAEKRFIGEGAVVLGCVEEIAS